MTISFGTSTRLDNFGSGSTSTITGNSPSVSGINTLGHVSIAVAGGSVAVTSVTWNGVAMTLVPSSSITSGTQLLVHYYIVNPPAGVSTVTVNGTWISPAFATVNYATGVHQVSPIDGAAVTNTAASSTTVTTTKTTSINSEYLLSIVFNDAPCTLPSGGTAESGGCNGVYSYNSGYMSTVTAGSNSYTWTTGSPFNCFASTYAIVPASSLLEFF